VFAPEELARLAGMPHLSVLVFADSHGSATFMRRAVAEHPETDLILHLGDHGDRLPDLASQAGRQRDALRMTGVAGNCDGWAGLHSPLQQLLVLAGHRVFLTHGQLFGVKQKLDRLIAAGAGAPNLADIILFGHTHHALEKKVDFAGREILLLNPGCCKTQPPDHPASALLLHLGAQTVAWEFLLDLP
jgi:uncharacterized protein